jgi:hypothetical protein
MPPTNSSQADLFLDIENLLTSCEQNASLLPEVAPFRDPLQLTLGEMKSLKALQENLEGNRKATTQRLTVLIQQAQEQARNLRDYIRARLGSKNEHLTQFGRAPIRKRTRKAKPAPAEPTDPEAPPTDKKPAA